MTQSISLKPMPHFHPRLRFSLRTLFVLVTVLCVWLGYYLNWIYERKAAVKRWEDRAYFVSGITDGKSPMRTRSAPVGLRVFGENGYIEINIFKVDAADDIFPKLRKLFPEADLNDRSGPISRP